jgi:hypothetical protein
MFFTFGQRPRRRDLRRHVSEIMRRTNHSRWVYLDGSYLSRLQITRMCDHNCVHKVGRTQTTCDTTAKTVSNQKQISCQWVVNRTWLEFSPNGTDPLITFLRFNLLDELYKLRFMDKAKYTRRRVSCLMDSGVNNRRTICEQPWHGRDKLDD